MATRSYSTAEVLELLENDELLDSEVEIIHKLATIVHLASKQQVITLFLGSYGRKNTFMIIKLCHYLHQ